MLERLIKPGEMSTAIKVGLVVAETLIWIPVG